MRRGRWHLAQRPTEAAAETLVLIKRPAHVRGGESFPKITHNPQDTRHCWVSFLLPPAGECGMIKQKGEGVLL